MVEEEAILVGNPSLEWIGHPSPTKEFKLLIEFILSKWLIISNSLFDNSIFFLEIKVLKVQKSYFIINLHILLQKSLKFKETI